MEKGLDRYVNKFLGLLFALGVLLSGCAATVVGRPPASHDEDAGSPADVVKVETDAGIMVDAATMEVGVDAQSPDLTVVDGGSVADASDVVVTDVVLVDSIDAQVEVDVPVPVDVDSCHEVTIPGLGEQVTLNVWPGWSIRRVVVNQVVLDSIGYARDSWTPLTLPASCSRVDILRFPVTFAGRSDLQVWSVRIEALHVVTGEVRNCLYPNYDGCAPIGTMQMRGEDPNLSRLNFLREDGSSETLFFHLPSGRFPQYEELHWHAEFPAGMRRFTILTLRYGDAAPSVLLPPNTLEQGTSPNPRGFLFADSFFIYPSRISTVEVQMGELTTRLATIDSATGRCRQATDAVQLVRVDRMSGTFEPVAVELLLETWNEGGVSRRECFLHVLGQICPPGRRFNRANGTCGEHRP